MNEKWLARMAAIGMKRSRMAFKARENAYKTRPSSPDLGLTTDFTFSKIDGRSGDSGDLLLATRKKCKNDKYLVKHAYTDCACNEFVYTKLVLAMGYHMPNALLIQLPSDEKRNYFKTEYIISETYLNLTNPFPSFAEIMKKARNRLEYFSFCALSVMLQESDGLETPLADDGYIYRVDTTAAFPIGNLQLECLGVDFEYKGTTIHQISENKLANMDLTNLISPSECDFWIEMFKKKEGSLWEKPFFEPFERIQEIRAEYIDGFLDTLCWIYPDCVGDFFKSYISALQTQAAAYLISRR